MENLNAKEIAADALRALRGDDVQPVDPPVAPDLRGLTEAAVARKIQDHEGQKAKYADYLMSKPSGSLTADEQRFLLREVAAWAQGGRR